MVSDAPGREAWLRLCYLDFHHLFDCVVTFEDTGERKPSAAPFLRALTLLNVKPEETLMVGDWAERDMVGAAQVGITTVFARYGDTFGTVDSHARYELNDVSELLDVIDRENALARRYRGDRHDPRASAWISWILSGSSDLWKPKEMRFLDKVFTQTEIAYCNGKARRHQHFAARFAAKEAVSKALATGWAGDFRWKDVEVTNDPTGQPRIVLARPAPRTHRIGTHPDIAVPRRQPCRCHGCH